MDVTFLIETFGLPGLALFAMGCLYMTERKERVAAQKSELETLRAVLPAIAALEAATKIVEGRK